jgi:hypothetical protein
VVIDKPFSHRSSVAALIPTFCETASTGELSGGSSRATKGVMILSGRQLL